MHFQKAPHAEVKLVRCTRGAVFDVAVDLRVGSPTFCQWFGTELDARVWPYALHSGGLRTRLPDARSEYRPRVPGSVPYAPQSATGVRHDDPAFNIAWPAAIKVISSQDRSWPTFLERRA